MDGHYTRLKALHDPGIYRGLVYVVCGVGAFFTHPGECVWLSSGLILAGMMHVIWPNK